MRTKISPLDALIATACTGLLLALLTFAALATAFAANEARPYHAEGELLVKFKGGPRGAAAERARDRMKHEVKRNFRHVGWQLIRLPQGMTVEEAMSVYQQLPDVLAVEPNFILGGADPLTNSVLDLEIASVSSAPNDPRFGSQWNLRVIGMTNAWAVTAGSPEVVVAVLDSGIDYTHEDLRDNMWRNPGETGLDPQGRDKATNGIDDDGNGHTDDVFGIDVVDNDSDPMDLGEGQPRTTGFFHGTACAGIIGARGNNGVGIAGVAWSVRMMAIRIAPTNNQIPLGNHLAGVEYMIAMKQRGVNLRASNHSYGGAVLFSQAWYDAGLSIEAEGVVAVHAAGNIGLDLDKLSRIPVTVDLPLLISV